MLHVTLGIFFKKMCGKSVEGTTYAIQHTQSEIENRRFVRSNISYLNIFEEGRAEFRRTKAKFLGGWFCMRDGGETKTLDFGMGCRLKKRDTSVISHLAATSQKKPSWICLHWIWISYGISSRISGYVFFRWPWAIISHRPYKKAGLLLTPGVRDLGWFGPAGRCCPVAFRRVCWGYHVF